MVSMQPSSERYDFKFKYMPNLCDPQPREPTNWWSMYEILKNTHGFGKMADLIKRGNLKELLSAPEKYSIGYTLFATTDINIPDSFAQNSDAGAARDFIESYLLIGTAELPYIISNGSSLYITKNKANPILAVVMDDRSVVVNKVGKILYSIPTGNGVIHVLSNIAQIAYDT